MNVLVIRSEYLALALVSLHNNPSFAGVPGRTDVLSANLRFSADLVFDLGSCLISQLRLSLGVSCHGGFDLVQSFLNCAQHLKI